MSLKNNISLGQHWLRNRAVLNEIAELAVGAGVRERCVEIGPGLGTLTSSLLKRFDEVIAVEYDADLAAKLPGQFPGKNLTVVHEDFLNFNLKNVPEPYVVAGNIPYYITSPIIGKLVKAPEHRPARIVLLMQKEVARRILSDKGSVLGLTVKNYATVTAGPVVRKGEFIPAPKFDSQVLILDPKEPEVGEEVLRLVRLGFASARKKLYHNIPGLTREALAQIGVSPDARAEELSLNDWQKLSEVI